VNPHVGAPLQALLLSLLFLAPLASPHNPVIVKSRSSEEQPVLIERPEVSYAYYGLMTGSPHFYLIKAARPFNLYVNILAPDLEPNLPPVLRHDLSFEIIRDGARLAAASGRDSDWRRFYEPFGRDHYYLGPEFEQTAQPGTYIIKVFNSANRGKYALAVGRKERFTPWGLIGAFFKARSLDRWFFKDDERR
jgi:hypothetical protein